MVGGRFVRHLALAVALPGACLLGVLPHRAAAQTIELEPSAVAACLSLPPNALDKPEYPFTAYKNDTPGRVLVDLHFTGATLRPAVEVLSSSGDDSFVGAVREHVRQLRVPCLPPGKDVHLRQEYVFQKDRQAVTWGRAIDPQDDQRRTLVRCMRHSSGKLQPDYPPDLLRQGAQGRVLVRLTFNSDDQAPTATIWNRPSASGFADAIKDWVQGYRLPCHAGEAITTNLIFVFRLDTDAFGFKPMGLLNFVAATRQIKSEGLQMDTRTMACPFDVKVMYRQPLRPNSVGVVGPADARRQPLLDWLTRAELVLSRRQEDAVFADTADIHVPCVDMAIAPDAVK